MKTKKNRVDRGHHGQKTSLTRTLAVTGGVGEGEMGEGRVPNGEHVKPGDRPWGLEPTPWSLLTGSVSPLGLQPHRDITRLLQETPPRTPPHLPSHPQRKPDPASDPGPPLEGEGPGRLEEPHPRGECGLITSHYPFTGHPSSTSLTPVPSGFRGDWVFGPR